MRDAYLAVDHPDISQTVKMLTTAMSSFREGHVGLLKGLAIVHSRETAEDAQLGVLVDSDEAGHVQSRRSTTEISVMGGYSATRQSSIVLTIAEAEYNALVRGACFGLGVQSCLPELELGTEHREEDKENASYHDTVLVGWATNQDEPSRTGMHRREASPCRSDEESIRESSDIKDFERLGMHDRIDH